MKIYLFNHDKIYNFILPNEIEGSYSFGADSEENEKLINIEAREGKWVIYSVDGAELIDNNVPIESMPLLDGSFYIIQKDNLKYLVYSCSFESDKMKTYSYKGLNLVVGQNANINYECPFLINSQVRIYQHENQFILQQSQQGLTYVNNKIITENAIYLQAGDYINIFGLKIIILNTMILMNNPGNKITIQNYNFGIKPLEITDTPGESATIQDKELYEKNSFFSKSPRIRRVIETKEVKLSPPPGNSGGGEMPLILTIGPMFTMGAISFVTIGRVIAGISSGETTIQKSWPQLITASAMLASMLFWPIIMRIYNKRMQKKQKKIMTEKYEEYLKKKEKEIANEVHLQRDILIENLITVNQCLDIIGTRNIGFWDKRIDQNDFLTVRLGMGRVPLDIEIEYNEEDFSIDEYELRQKADELSQRYKYINNVPVGYSFKENKITAIMGFDKRESFDFTHNLLLQLLTFYSYEDLKLVIFTTEKNQEQWEYVRYLNHNFTNDKRFRFFASDSDSAKAVMDYLGAIMHSRFTGGGKKEIPDKPHFLVIIDEYDSVKRQDFIKELTESDEDDGFSVIILEEKLSKLPSKCNSFISLAPNSSSVLKNSYEGQEQIPFKEEIFSKVNMMNIAKILSNIPIEFEEGEGNIPDAVTFLEMHGVGKVEQLNVLNRWNTNDSTVSLKAEIGIDNQENLMYLDLHEKAHGPHGLIAGTTGSGKSEFIITYVLSMCINYSPDDISFILIDYKGGGLALAFENKAINVVLPHLAGTITNLDKAEMDRTLVSINSEAKRRQQLFNEARDITGESTMDIYKYQRLFKEGKLKEPVSHLFIICDEFAELKAQQPDFMDNLISIARIGRSLGVHLILATQKPTGVVNEQIWSNTRFRVCLKVQDESDSKEMLKKPDAAHITQAGRYYLQVGYDEIYALGQSGYTGAKYFPSNKIVKQVDKSINFINDFGAFIKSIQASTGSKSEAQGEQLQAVLKVITEVAEKTEKKSRRLWLENIPEVILIDDLEKKYNFTKEDFHPKALIGEYDAPEKQEQGEVVYDLIEQGNTAVYGTDGVEREMFLNALIYSLCKNYTADEINIYAIDYGSESLRRFSSLPQVGGMAFPGEEEKYSNLIKLLREEMSERKKLFVNYGGEYKTFIKSSEEKMPLILVLINNYDAINESDPKAYEVFPDITRDSDRYGIVYAFTGNGITTFGRKLAQNLPLSWAFKLKDTYDYAAVFNTKTKLVPRDLLGRGAIKNDGVHEFQNAKILAEDSELNEFLKKFTEEQKNKNKTTAKIIPVLPKTITYDDIKDKVTDIMNIPIGITKKELEISYLNQENYLGTIISANRIASTINFSKSLLYIINRMENTTLLIIDPKSMLKNDKDNYQNYYTENLEQITPKIIEYITNQKEQNNNMKIVLFIFGISRYLMSLENSHPFTDFIIKMRGYENFKVIISDDFGKIKNFQFEEWFKTSFSVSDGIWIDNGISEQNLFKLASITKELTKKVPNNNGYTIIENNPVMTKFIDFFDDDNSDLE